MKAVVRPFLLLAAACAVLSLPACANVGTHREPPTRVVPIKDIQEVTGQWSGLLKRRPRTHGDDFVTVTISRDGTYEFASARISGIFAGTRTFQFTDGRLRDESESGHAVFTLYDRDGEQVLLVEAHDARNDYEYRGELTRAQ